MRDSLIHSSTLLLLIPFFYSCGNAVDNKRKKTENPTVKEPVVKTSLDSEKLNEQILILENKIRELQTSLDKVGDEKGTLQNSTAENEKELVKLREEKEILGKRVNTIAENNNILTINYNIAVKENDAHKDQLKKFKNDLGDMQVHLDKSNIKISDLGQELSNVLKENIKLNKSIDVFLSDKKQINNKLKILENNIHNLNEELNNSNGSNKILQKQLDTSLNEKENLLDKLNKCTLEHEKNLLKISQLWCDPRKVDG